MHVKESYRHQPYECRKSSIGEDLDHQVHRHTEEQVISCGCMDRFHDFEAMDKERVDVEYRASLYTNETLAEVIHF